MSITITVPNDDHVALRAMAKALEEIAMARGAVPRTQTHGAMNYTLNIDTTQATAALKELVKQAEVDTTSEQFDSLTLGEEIPGTIEERGDNDANGTPWDERIHSASKALNADGSWRLRRKPKDMDEAEWAALVESVKVELQHGDAIRESMDKAERGEAVYHTSKEAEQKMEEFKESVRQRAEPSVTSEGDDFHVDAGEVTEQEVAAIPVPPLPPVPPAPPVQQSDMTFPQVMQFLTERHGRITSAQVDDIIADMDLNSIMDLNTQPEHTGPFIARVKALLGE